jgi:hypothetical protein
LVIGNCKDNLQRLSFVVVLLLSLHAVGAAQPQPVSLFRDTVVGPASSAADTGAFHPTKSAWLAVGLSALVPGAGQIYDESYWKVPVIWGVGGYWIYEWGQLNNKYHEYGDLYDQTHNQTYQSVRDFYHDERDKFAWFLGALYVLNLADAFVSAQLYDFTVSPNLTSVDRMPPVIGATIRFRF